MRLSIKVTNQNIYSEKVKNVNLLRSYINGHDDVIGIINVETKEGKILEFKGNRFGVQDTYYFEKNFGFGFKKETVTFDPIFDRDKFGDENVCKTKYLPKMW